MYAIISCGGKQYRVQPSDKIRVEKINQPKGETIEISDVHMVSTGDQIIIEPEKLKNALVVAEILNHGRSKKIRVFKYKRRKNYHRTYGHRQWFTELMIKEIKLN